jgi:hypothetical protein
VGVGDGDSCEEASACRVGISVVGVVAPAVADDDELAAYKGRVGGGGLVIGACRTRM